MARYKDNKSNRKNKNEKNSVSAFKVTVIILSSLIVIGVALGLWFYFSSQSGDIFLVKPTVASEEEFDGYMDEDMSGEEYIVDDPETEEETEATEKSDDDFDVSDKDLSDNTADVTTTNFAIVRVVDHTTGLETQPRVVFGSGFKSSDNYIRFDSDGNFEMYLSGYNNNVTRGTYADNGDTIYVEYSDGTAAEYKVSHNDENIINYIIVNYGDYDIYFA